MKETRRERFVRIAEDRVNEVIDDLTLIGKMAEKNYYEYDKDDVEHIREALHTAVDEACSRLLDPARSRFKLDN